MGKRTLILGLILCILILFAVVPIVSLLIPKTTADADLEIRLYQAQSDSVARMRYADFLTGCVAACLDFTQDYPKDALLAITVAAQGRALSLCGRCADARAAGADFCDHPDHGGDFLFREQAEERWGKSKSDVLFGQIGEAVREILGFGVCYEGQLALTLMHESSYLLTENASEVLGREIPYLQSARSYEEPEVREIILEKSAVELLLRSVYGSYEGDPEIVERTAAGRVSAVKLGQRTVSGIEFADLLMLPSTDFTVAQSDDRWIFTVRGGGNGLGLSRMGAVELARQGMNFEQILSHYYPGTRLLPIDIPALIAFGRDLPSDSGCQKSTFGIEFLNFIVEN